MAGALSITTNARIAVLCALAALSACDKGSSPTLTPTPQVKTKPAPVKKGPTAAELTTGMVEAAAQGKAQGVVDLKFELAQKPKVGQPLEINLAVLPQIDAASATIQVSGADGFQLADGAAQFDLAGVAAGEVYRHTLNLTPVTEGVWVIGVTLVFKSDDNPQTLAFSIPVIVDR